MLSNPGSSWALWSVELAIVYLLLAISFGLGRWSVRNRKSSGQEKERAAQAAAQIQALADRVAQDVGEHSTRVREISTDLGAADRSGAPLNDVVLKSIDDIVKANARLQEQLATAEVKLQRQAAELETQTTVARTDPLTLLSNRRALDDEMNRRFAEWTRRKTIFSLIMIDVDHFKKLNDKHGHQAGDQVLRDVAATLGTTVREMDLAARYGGEEFAIILPSTPI
ncbi:MAG TPA: GGDEF domain-containing protein, partial [Pirellulales bacterium]|nr:GGDEF domain-containing protein [Pirellulales bacterium]